MYVFVDIIAMRYVNWV